MRDTIYLDAAASAPLAPEAFEATVAALGSVGNPGAAHTPGHLARRLVEDARSNVADLAGVGAGSVIFTASATEANNLALRGIATSDGRRRYVTTTAEHPSTLATLRDLVDQDQSCSLVIVDVGLTGEVDLGVLERAVTDETALVSVHAANNETGVMQPLPDIVSLAHRRGAMVHTDASQLMAWGPTSLIDECDLVTISSHKMYGPQGAAALIARPTARDALRPQATGGGQERGLRSGTANVAALAGFGAAAALAIKSGRDVAGHVRVLRDELRCGLTERIGDISEHGAGARFRLPGILNVSVGATLSDSAESEVLLARVPSVAASTGSACHAGAPGPSPILMAMGISNWEASRSIRFSLSRYTTANDVYRAVSDLSAGYAELVRLFDVSN